MKSRLASKKAAPQSAQSDPTHLSEVNEQGLAGTVAIPLIISSGLVNDNIALTHYPRATFTTRPRQAPPLRAGQANPWAGK